MNRLQPKILVFFWNHFGTSQNLRENNLQILMDRKGSWGQYQIVGISKDSMV